MDLERFRGLEYEPQDAETEVLLSDLPLDIIIGSITTQFNDPMEYRKNDFVQSFITKYQLTKENVVEEEEEEEELTGEELAEMDFEELEDVCDDKDLETDPDDYDEDEVEKLRKAIAKELGLKLPAKKETKGKGKKGKK